MFAKKCREYLRQLAQRTVLSVHTETTEKSAEKADFFGYSCIKVRADENAYACISGDVIAVTDGRYLFEQEDVISLLFPQGKVFSLQQDVYFLGQIKEITFIEIDRVRMRDYYAFLALYSAFCVEKDKSVARRQKAILAGKDRAKIEEELNRKENRTEQRVVRYIPHLPPLYCFPDSVIKELLKGLGESVCFPQGGVWQGLLDVLEQSNVKRIILPGNGESVRLSGRDISVYYEKIPSSEEKLIYSYLSGYRGYPVWTEATFSPPVKEGTMDFFLPPAPTFPRIIREIGDEGSCEGLTATKDGIFSNLLSVTERKGTFTVGDKYLLTVLSEKGRKCGRMAQKTYLSGRFAVAETHYYYRDKTLRLRLMIEREKNFLYIDCVGRGFLLTLEATGVKKVQCNLPFQNALFEPTDGLFRARDKIILIGEKEIGIYSDSLTCEKKGNSFLFPLVTEKTAFIID